MEHTHTFIDFCAGIGGGRLGAQKAGMKCLSYLEIDDDPIKTYKLFYGDKEKNYGNIMNINIEEIPKFDVMIGGFPCQSYSIAGLRAGLKDTNGEVILGLLKILKKKQPKYFILENVKGLVNINKGESIKFITEQLINANYSVSWKVLNSIDFGVAQMRERVYFVGIRKDIKKKFNWNKVMSYKKQSNITDFLINDKSRVLDHRMDKTFNKYLNNKYNKGKYNIEEILEDDFTVIDTRQSDLRIYKGRTPTLRAGRHGILYTKNGQLKKLSGIEALVLQGFPLELAQKAQKTLPENKILKQAGNAMTVNVIKAIADVLIL